MNKASDRPDRRRIGTRSVLLGGVLGAALPLGAVLLVWVRQSFGADFLGRLSRQGFQAAPAVVPLALVGLAGLVAAFAGRGLVGRLIGLLLAGDGIALGIAGLAPLVSPPRDATAGTSGLPAPAELMGPVSVSWWGPVLTAVGGLLVAVTGAAVLAGAMGGRLGSRYDAPNAGPSAPLSPDVAGPDAALDWWKALDAGDDPTESMNSPEGVQQEGSVRSDRPGRLP